MAVQLAVNDVSALDEFSYKNGYALTVTDLGAEGVRLELIHPSEGSSAVIMPPDKTSHCARWMLRTLALREHGLPAELPQALHRLVNNRTLKRGEKKKVRDAIRILRDWEGGNQQTV